VYREIDRKRKRKRKKRRKKVLSSRLFDAFFLLKLNYSPAQVSDYLCTCKRTMSDGRNHEKRDEITYKHGWLLGKRDTQTHQRGNQDFVCKDYFTSQALSFVQFLLNRQNTILSDTNKYTETH